MDPGHPELKLQFSKPYRKEVLELKLRHFKNPSKFGLWPAGAEATAVSQPWQRAEDSEAAAVSQPLARGKGGFGAEAAAP